MQPLAPLIWLTAPDSDGWWICARREKHLVELWLVRVESGRCFTESGSACGTPATAEFHGVRWLGPAERP